MKADCETTLTNAQRRLLQLALDTRGHEVRVRGAAEVTMARKLALRGLLTVPPKLYFHDEWSTRTWLLTDQGRAALSTKRETVKR